MITLGELTILDVITLGAAAMDLVAKVKRFPSTDDIVFVEEFHEFPGGSTANIAVGLSRLGLKVGFVGKMGDDQYGKTLIGEFKREAVDTSRCLIKKNVHSATTFIAVDKDGRRMIYALGGTAVLESPEELDRDYMADTRVLYVGEAFPEVAYEAIQCAKSSDAYVVYGPGILTQFGLTYIKHVIKKCNLLLISEAETKTLIKEEPIVQKAPKLLKYGPEVVVLTMGRRGAIIISETGKMHVPAFKARIVDTTGAGDAFASGLVYGIRQGWHLRKAVKFGNAAAAVKISRLGARTGLPTLEEIETFLRTTKNEDALDSKDR